MRTDRELLADAVRLIESHRRGNTIMTGWRDQVVEEIRSKLAEPVTETCAPASARGAYNPTGLDQLLERIRFLERQIAEKKNR